MDTDVDPSPREKRRNHKLIIGVSATTLLVVLSASLGLGLTLSRTSFKSTFITRCEDFTGKGKRDDCQKMWSAFEQAYVGKDPCKVSMEAYDLLLSLTAPEPTCNRMMFWSKTMDLVHKFTKKRDCFVTLEDILLGYVVSGLPTWCGKEGSNETFTTGCPEWTECNNNPVRSFWIRASAASADAACGDVTVMLSGSIAEPYNPTSIFATIEVKRFNSSRMKSLSVVLVKEEKDVTDCNNPSLQKLQKDLDQNIAYSCQEVPVSKIHDCMSNPDILCRACW